jgi:putative ribosome biogenesis GTPase RsgA
MADSSMRTFIAFGLTGSGKSFMLNLLYGVEDPDDEKEQYFKCANIS